MTIKDGVLTILVAVMVVGSYYLFGVGARGIFFPDPPPLLHENPEVEAQLYADVRQRTQTLPGGESLNQGYIQWKSYVIFIVRHYFMEGMAEDLDYVYKWDGRAWLFVERWQWRTHIYRRDA